MRNAEGNEVTLLVHTQASDRQTIPSYRPDGDCEITLPFGSRFVRARSPRPEYRRAVPPDLEVCARAEPAMSATPVPCWSRFSCVGGGPEGAHARGVDRTAARLQPADGLQREWAIDSAAPRRVRAVGAGPAHSGCPGAPVGASAEGTVPEVRPEAGGIVVVGALRPGDEAIGAERGAAVCGTAGQACGGVLRSGSQDGQNDIALA